MREPEIINVQWSEVEQWLRFLKERLEFDTILGISRSGIPLAVAASYLCSDAKLAFVERTRPRGEKPQFYDFSSDRASRVARLEKELHVTASFEVGQRILILDDVATTGDTLQVVASKLRRLVPSSQFRFACYAVDEARLTASNPELVSSIAAHMRIDNARTWLSFPWNLVP